VAVGDVPLAVCTAVVESMRLRSAQVALETDGRAHVVASVGEPGPVEEAFDLRHRGALVGRLSVSLRAGEQQLDVRDRELVAALADQAAPAVDALRLLAELQAGREALVASREEERRRLRRDLHDGVGAALAGARLQLESARALVDDPLTQRLLDAAGGAVVEAVDDVRRITEDLRPPALDEIGLAGSLAALADRMRTPSLDVTADVAPLPPLPAALEVACFRIAGEALANAARHARATRVVLRLEADEADLRLEVSDDGRGFTGERPGGLGLTSMRQRAEELGGRLEVLSSSPRAGTTVRATLPRTVG
jgi:signal transduction histidine kinase